MVSTTGSLLLMADAAWRVSVVLGSAWAITRLAGRRSAALRHSIWAAALVAAIAVPLVGGAVPGWRVPILPAPAEAVTTPVRLDDVLCAKAGAIASAAIRASDSFDSWTGVDRVMCATSFGKGDG